MPKLAYIGRRGPTSGLAAIVLVATVVLGGLAGSAGAAERDSHRGDYHHRNWNGGYYRAPPVVYGTPYYQPPVVYGPGLNINIR
jgi:hypothetical protein